MTSTVERWLEGYKTAWETRDADAAAALFTEDARYRDQPYEEAAVGRQGVHDYWTRVTATQSDVRFRTGRPIVDGDRAAVEWWVTMRNDGFEMTLAGEFYLVFEGDLVRELREYWHFGEGAIEAPEGWGR